MPSVKEIVVGQTVKYGLIGTVVIGGGAIAYKKIKSGFGGLNPINNVKEGFQSFGEKTKDGFQKVGEKTGISKATNYITKGGAIKDTKSVIKKSDIKNKSKKAAARTEKWATQGGLEKDTKTAYKKSKVVAKKTKNVAKKTKKKVKSGVNSIAKKLKIKKKSKKKEKVKAKEPPPAVKRRDPKGRK